MLLMLNVVRVSGIVFEVDMFVCVCVVCVSGVDGVDVCVK